MDQDLLNLIEGVLGDDFGFDFSLVTWLFTVSQTCSQTSSNTDGAEFHTTEPSNIQLFFEADG